MSHFAHVNSQGIVDNVIVIEAETLALGHWGDPSEWVQTSYNTIGGVHINGGTPLRANYAGIGYVYDKTNDVFHASRPVDRNGVSCESFTIGAPTWQWVNPVAMPVHEGKIYAWDEPTKAWVDVTPVIEATPTPTPEVTPTPVVTPTPEVTPSTGA
jgi:hypothetical protein